MSDQKSTPQSDLQNLEFVLDKAVEKGALTKMQVVAATQSLVNLNEFMKTAVAPVVDQSTGVDNTKIKKEIDGHAKERTNYGSSTDPH